MGKARRRPADERQEGDNQPALKVMAGVFLLALCVRAAYLYDSSDNPTFSAPVVDSLTYDQLAREIVEAGQMGEEFFWQPCFYPLFLSAVYCFSDSSVIFARIVQALLGCVTCVLIYRLGERIFGRSAGVLSGLVAAFYGPLIFFEAELLAAGWAAFWSVVLVWVLIGASEKPSVWRGFVLGLCGILSIITRPVFVPFFAAGCIWLMVVWLRLRVQPRKLLLGLVSIAAGFLAVAAPVGFLSYQTTGKATLLPHSGGVNFYIGNNPDYKETVTIRPGLRWQELMELPSKQGIHDRYDRERFFVDKTVCYVVGQPLSFLQGLAYKATQFCSSREIPRNVDVYSFRKWSWLLRAGVWKVGGFGFPFGVLLPLAVVGGVYWRRIIPGPIWLFMIFYPASVILVFVTSRYRVPIVPLMSVLAAGGCAAIWKMLKGRQSAQLVVAGVIILGTGLASGVPGPFGAEQIDYEPELYYGLGDSLDKRGRTADGIKSYSKAISLRGDYVEAHHNIALLLMKQEQVDEAVAHLNTAIELEPGHAALYKDLGNALVKQGKVDDAIAHYSKAIQIDPKHVHAHRQLGLALASLGKFDAAIDHYNQALELEPDDADTHYSLGVAFQMRGKLDEAIRQYTEALKIEPNLANAHSNLGVIFAGKRKFDDAISSLTEALRIQPNSVEVQYNLGRVLQSKGQVDEAIDAYRKVLAIDPDHKRAHQALEKLAQ